MPFSVSSELCIKILLNWDKKGNYVITIPVPVTVIVLQLQYVLLCPKFLETPTKRYFSY